MICAWQWCSLMANYFDQLLICVCLLQTSRNIVVTLFNINTPEFYSILSAMPKSIRVINFLSTSLPFSALTLLVWQQEEHLACKKLEWWGAGMIICVERSARDLHMVQLMSLPPHHLCISKMQSEPTVFTLLYNCSVIYLITPSVLWRCWLGVRKGIGPVKSDWWGASMVIFRSVVHIACIWFSYATATPSSLLQQNPERFILLVPTHPGSPGQRVVKRL